MEELCSILLYEVWAINVIQFKIQFSSHRYRPEWRSCLYQCALIPTTGRLASLRCVGRWTDSGLLGTTAHSPLSTNNNALGQGNKTLWLGTMYYTRKTKHEDLVIYFFLLMRWEDKEGKRGRRWVTHWNKQAGRRRWVCSWSLTRPSCCNSGRR